MSSPATDAKGKPPHLLMSSPFAAFLSIVTALVYYSHADPCFLLQKNCQHLKITC